MVESIYWIDSDGGALNLTDGVKYTVLQGLDGRFMPPFEIVSYVQYKGVGDSVRMRTTKAREVVIPLMVSGTSVTDFRNNMRMLTDAFDPMRGDGFLKVITPDSKTLLLKCHYKDGMTMPEDTDTGGCTFRKFVITFLAHEPIWFNALENERLWYGDYVDYVQDINNAGDVDTWPIWELSGSVAGVTAITIKNISTGDHFTVTLGTSHIHTSDHLYVDTRPNTVAVLKNHVTNEWDKVSTTSLLFPLIPGVNQISLTVTGNDSGTYIKCRWVDRYYGV